MVDPVNFTKFDRTVIELEEMALFSLLVAGKNALTTARALERLLQEAHQQAGLFERQPFDSLRKYGRTQLERMLVKAGVGCYKAKAKGLHQLVHSGLDLRTCRVEDLEAIHGIGLKTSRMFVLHSRPGAQVACLDVHILHYLTDRGYNVPRSTPSGHKKYREIEALFLKLAGEAGMTPADFDLSIWRQYSGRAA